MDLVPRGFWQLQLGMRAIWSQVAICSGSYSNYTALGLADLREDRGNTVHPGGTVIARTDVDIRWWT
jgi:hypothetical protein